MFVLNFLCLIVSALADDYSSSDYHSYKTPQSPYIDFMVYHSFNRSMPAPTFNSLVDPGFATMLELNQPYPVYNQSDIDQLHQDAYQTLQYVWGLNADPTANTSIPGPLAGYPNGTWFVTNNGTATHLCMEFSEAAENHTVKVVFDSRPGHEQRVLDGDWRQSVHIINCVAVARSVATGGLKVGTTFQPGSAVWAGAFDYFRLGQDMRYGYDPSKRIGPNWEHWPMWAPRTGNMIINDQGHSEYKFHSKVLSPVSDAFPNGNICDYVDIQIVNYASDAYEMNPVQTRWQVDNVICPGPGSVVDVGMSELPPVVLKKFSKDW